MKSFDNQLPVRLRFGPGRIAELAQALQPHGNRVLLVAGRWDGAKRKLHERCRELLDQSGLDLAVYDGARPNPTTAMVSAAAEIGKRHDCDLVLGVGGGSVMDVAKAAAVEMTHELGCFDYAYFQPQQPGSATLPIVLVTTTSGTGSHVSKCSVITHADTRIKTGIVSDHLYAREAIIDPELMLSVPPRITAATGFDVFTHAFESFINQNATPMADLCAREAIRLLSTFLPRAVSDGSDAEARAQMAWADTLAGMCIANVGTTLPHSMAQPISGHYPQVSHGEALAMVYPPILSLSWPGAVERFAEVTRLLNPELAALPDREAARSARTAVEELLGSIGLTSSFAELEPDAEALEALVVEAMSFPDTRVHPVVPSEKQVRDMFQEINGGGSS